MENKIEKFKKENNKLMVKKIESQLNLVLKGQEINQKELRLGFVVLATQNQDLLNLNKQLTEQLKIVVAELNVLKKKMGRKGNSEASSCKP